MVPRGGVSARGRRSAGFPAPKERKNHALPASPWRRFRVDQHVPPPGNETTCAAPFPTFNAVREKSRAGGRHRGRGSRRERARGEDGRGHGRLPRRGAGSSPRRPPPRRGPVQRCPTEERGSTPRRTRRSGPAPKGRPSSPVRGCADDRASGSTPNAPPTTAMTAPATPATRDRPEQTFPKDRPGGTAWKKAAIPGIVRRNATVAATTASFTHQPPAFATPLPLPPAERRNSR